MNGAPRKDLVALVADKNMEFALKGLLMQHRALGIRPLQTDVYVHPERDPGCFLRGHDFLHPFFNRYAHALLILDRQGSGRESSCREDLESEAEKRLSQSGWNDRAAAVVLDPELEIWVWSDSPHVGRVLGWPKGRPSLRTWLREQGF